MIQYFYLLALVFIFSCAPSSNESTVINSSNSQNSDLGELSEEFYENGALKSVGRLVDGKRNGKWNSYYPDGKNWSESSYDMNILQGKTTVYYPNGFLHYKGAFRKGKRTGRWVFYLEDGKIDYEKDYPG